MKTRWSSLLLASLVTAFLAVNGCSSKLKVSKNPDEIKQMAKEAYIYGYPLVLMDKTKDVMTGVTHSVSEGIGAKAPVNQLAYTRVLPDHTFMEAATPNADTLSSYGWLDLSDEPQIISIPDSGKRYYFLSMLDAYTNVFFSSGTRTTGSQAQTYAIVGPSWKGDLPADVKRVSAPTNMVWVMARTSTKGAADYAAAHEWQDKLTMVPMSSWGKSYRAPNVEVNPNADVRTLPTQQVMNLRGAAFFSRMAELMKTNPPAPADGDQLRRFAGLGIIPGKNFDPNLLTEDGQRALEEGAREGYQAILADAKNPTVESKDGWTYIRNLGMYGTDYKKRAAVAMMGLGAGLDAEAIYPRATVDRNGEPLSGKNRYKIHFTKATLPPVNGFWSLSLYDSKQAFVKNPIHRVTLGDRDNLKYNKDGSLDVYIQNKSPGKALQSNWLPAPKGEFSLVLRLYGPKESVLSGAWKVPGIERVSPPPRMGRTAAAELN